MFSVKIYHCLQVCDYLQCANSVQAVLEGAFTTTCDNGTEIFPYFHVGKKYRHDLNFLGITFSFLFFISSISVSHLYLHF